MGVLMCGWEGVIDFTYYCYGDFDNASVQLKFERLPFAILWLVFMLLDLIVKCMGSGFKVQNCFDITLLYSRP